MPGGGGFGGMGGPMEFGKSKSKFSEVPETGITFDDVAVSTRVACNPGTPPRQLAVALSLLVFAS